MVGSRHFVTFHSSLPNSSISPSNSITSSPRGSLASTITDRCRNLRSGHKTPMAPCHLQYLHHSPTITNRWYSQRILYGINKYSANPFSVADLKPSPRPSIITDSAYLEPDSIPLQVVYPRGFRWNLRFNTAERRGRWEMYSGYHPSGARSRPYLLTLLFSATTHFQDTLDTRQRRHPPHFLSPNLNPNLSVIFPMVLIVPVVPSVQ